MGGFGLHRGPLGGTQKVTYPGHLPAVALDALGSGSHHTNPFQGTKTLRVV